MQIDILREFINQLPEGVLIVNSFGIIHLTNTKVLHILKQHNNNIEGFKLSTVSRLSENEIFNLLKISVRSRQPVPIHIPLIDNDGNEVDFTMSGFLFTPASHDTEAKIMLRLKRKDLASNKFLTLNNQIETQKKTMRLLLKSKKELQKTSEKLKNYFNIVDKYVITSSTDINGNIVRVSKAFCNLFQYNPKELIGKYHNIIHNPDTDDTLIKKLWNTISKGDSWHGEVKDLAKDGSCYYLDVHIEPDYNEYGELIGFTSIQQDITDKKTIEELSQRDPLTKLYNRLKLDAVTSDEIERASRYKTPLCVILMDIDHFKHINDKYGHLVGDTTLIELSNILTLRIRDVDTVGRWGGEEFLIICPGTDLAGAKKLAEDIRQSIEGHIFSEVGKTTCSFGVSAFQPNDTYETLLNSADMALYEAKSAGRNQVKVKHIIHSSD